MTEVEKPEKLIPEHLEYLTELRDSGRTNMFAASPFLAAEFPDLTDREAREIVTYWMRTL